MLSCREGVLFPYGFNPNLPTRIPVIVKREFPVGSAQDYL